MGCSATKSAGVDSTPSDVERVVFTPSDAERVDFWRAMVAIPRLRGSPVMLVDARYLVKLASTPEGRLLRRQELPKEAFLSLAELEGMEEGPGLALRVVVVSYPWLQPDHPDPLGTSLQLLARVLKAYIAKAGGTCGVFLECVPNASREDRCPLVRVGPKARAAFESCWLSSFCSLHQKGAADAPRAPAEAELFGMALGNLSDWYSHPKTVVIKLTKMPAGYPAGFKFAEGTTPNTADYFGRGWCYKESSVANLVKDYDFCLDVGKLSDAATSWNDIVTECQTGRPAPLTPEDFFEELQRKSFTSKKADLLTVSRLYKAAFDKRLGEATTLRYTTLGWGDAEMLSLSKVIACGALASCESLALDVNQIGDAGMEAFASACAGGAMARLVTLVLLNNQIGDAGVEALAKAAAGGALAKCQVLCLQYNRIGDAGVEALAKAAACGALASCRQLELDSNQISDAGVTALAGAIASGAMPSLKTLGVDDGPLGTEHPALKAACEARGIELKRL